MKTGYKLRIHADEKKPHLVVTKDTHDAIKAFARVNDMTITEATQYLLEKAIREIKGEH